MQRTWVRAWLGFVLAMIPAAAWSLRAQSAPALYAKMAPLSQYLMSRQADVALAKSAAPPSISDHAEVVVMGGRDYETVVKGTNGFLCLVERSWTAGANDPDFWNPRLRGPLCLNPAAARSYFPITRLKTQLILAGKSKTEMFQAVAAAFQQKRLPAIEPGAMCYMLSKQGYLADADNHWHPHLMFFVAPAPDASWGANLPGTPVIVAQVPEDHLTIVMVLVARWSDGSLDTSVRN